ncbi:hypothetical protein H9Q69_013235 [Fusarium xylarioides]|nr:hypothetical protein H9Q69_013235 [Fusarium xylarioides]
MIHIPAGARLSDFANIIDYRHHLQNLIAPYNPLNYISNLIKFFRVNNLPFTNIIMFSLIPLLSLLVAGSHANPFLDARGVASAELPAKLSAIKFNPANKDGVTFHIAAAGVDTQCYPPANDTVAPGRIYKCGEDAAVTFSYTSEDGKLSVWLSNENGSFAGSTLVSGPVEDGVTIDLASLNG